MDKIQLFILLEFKYIQNKYSDISKINVAAYTMLSLDHVV